MTDPKRAAVYLRVSTDEQTVENQRPDLERIAATRGLAIVATFEESASAVKKRPAFAAMMDAARAGRFDVLLVWAIDRFGRSTFGNMADVRELDHVGVGIVSAQEPWLDTSGPLRPVLVAFASWVAEQERTRLVERTKAGIERARRQGKTLGRPARVFDVAEARRLHADGASVRALAMKLHVPRSVVARALGRPEKGSPGEGSQPRGKA